MSVVDCWGWGVLDLFTLTFDSSPIKGEGESGWCCLVSPCPVDSRLRGNDGRFSIKEEG